MASRCFLDLSNEIMLEIIDILVISSSRKGQLNEPPTLLKNLSIVNRRLRALVRPILLESITLGRPRVADESRLSWIRALQTIGEVWNMSGVLNHIKRVDLDFSKTSPALDLWVQDSTKIVLMINFLRSLENLKRLKIFLDIPDCAFRKVLIGAGIGLSLQFKTIETLHVDRATVYFLRHCPRVRRFAMSNDTIMNEAMPYFSGGPPNSFARDIIHYEIGACREFLHVGALGVQYPHLQHIRIMGFEGCHEGCCFKGVVLRIRPNFRDLKVLAVSGLFCSHSQLPLMDLLRECSSSKSRFNYGYKCAEFAFRNIHSLEELHIGADVVARRISDEGWEGLEKERSRTTKDRNHHRVYQSAGGVQWVWTLQSDPWVRQVDWILEADRE